MQRIEHSVENEMHRERLREIRERIGIEESALSVSSGYEYYYFYHLENGKIYEEWGKDPFYGSRHVELVLRIYQENGLHLKAVK